MRPPPVNGFTMNMWAVAGFASSGTRLETASILRSASARPYGVPAMLGAAGISSKLSRPGDGHLNQKRGKRRQNYHREQRDRIVSALAILATTAVATKQRGEVRHTSNHHDRGRHRRGNRTDQNVAMLHVSQLVRNDSFQLVLAQHLQDALGRRHRRVRRVPSGSKRIRRRDPE